MTLTAILGCLLLLSELLGAVAALIPGASGFGGIVATVITVLKQLGASPPSGD